ncbi:hypothetical protein [Parahalioglobus pacificus]|uniref:hypothetical protein n=1 Tax=Parahalioglobus pacificus TaxID=930806 RepID=UPI0016775BC3|nr:hypothetical protein [Halioglobus pacificus]NQY03352.1 hypothetical protein [Halieaceae bacterium]
MNAAQWKFFIKVSAGFIFVSTAFCHFSGLIDFSEVGAPLAVGAAYLLCVLFIYVWVKKNPEEVSSRS